MKIKALTMIAAVAVLGGLSVAASAQRDIGDEEQRRAR